MKSSLATYWRTFANGTRSGFPEILLLLFLVPFSLIYALAQKLRPWLYQLGLCSDRKLSRPVISIGNLSVGGTGKTPVAAYIANLLIKQGLQVAVLSRGYGGSLEGQCAIVSDGKTIRLTARECGDEPLLLAATVPGLMVVIGSDRYAAGMLALEQISPDIFLLDDGFQHLALQRDLDILLLDCKHPFGNGWTLPAGLLRELPGAAQRADLIVQTRCPEKTIPPAVPGKPFCCARHTLSDLVPLSGGAPLTFAELRESKVLAFAGIAEPQSFFADLQQQGLNLVHTLCLADHSAYNAATSAQITAALLSSGADFAITTQKDGVKLGHLPPQTAQKILLARLDLSIADPAPLLSLLHNLLQK